MVNFKLLRTYPIGFAIWVINIGFISSLIFAEFYFLKIAFNVLENKGAYTYWQFVLFFFLSFVCRATALVLYVFVELLLANWRLKAIRLIGSEILLLLSKSRLNYYNNINKEGKILSTLQNDLNIFISSRQKLIALYILNISILASSALFLIINNWIFGLIVVLSFVIMQLTPKSFKQQLEKINTSQSRANQDYIADFSEALDNHLPLRLMHSAKLLKREMLRSSKQEIKTRYLGDRFSTLVSNISNLIFFSGQRIFILAAILLYSAGYFQGFLGLGDILSLPQVLATLVNSLSFLVNSKLHQESANNYLKILKDQVNNIEKNIIHNSSHDQNTNIQKVKSLASSPHAITITNLSFSYTEKEVFKNLNLNFESGIIYGIQGSSGIGKSTLISLILGKHDNYQGSIKIGKREIRELGKENIFDLVKLVDSSNFVFDATIEENITLFDESLDPLPALKNAALLEEFKSLAQQKIEASNLSEGQKQRVNLARLFQNLGESKILILDEALSNLDRESREKVKESFLELKDRGYTLICISHHIDKEDKFYDQLINLEEEVRKTKSTL